MGQKLYVVTYIHRYDDRRTVMCVTNDFDAWLIKHNIQRVLDNEDTDLAEDFEVNEVQLEFVTPI